LRELRRFDLLEKYGPSAETPFDKQLELLELEAEVSNAEIEAESQREQLSLPLKTASVRNHSGRQQLPAELPKQEQIIACTAAQCVCGKCGRPTSVVGDTSPWEIYDYGIKPKSFRGRGGTIRTLANLLSSPMDSSVLMSPQ
jgi:hypothetical protein